MFEQIGGHADKNIGAVAAVIVSIGLIVAIRSLIDLNKTIPLRWLSTAALIALSWIGFMRAAPQLLSVTLSQIEQRQS